MKNNQYKKIIYIANARIPTEKAHGVAIMKMCDAFARAGIEVKLIIPNRSNVIKNNSFEYYNMKKEFDIIKLPCLDFIFLGRFGFLTQALSFAISATLYSLFSKSDLIYARDEFSLFFLSFFKNNLIWEAHTARKNFIVGRIVKKIKKIVFITKGLEDFYVKLYDVNRKKMFVAPSGVDVQMFDIQKPKSILRGELELPFNKKIIGYIGKYKTMGIEKGVNELIEVFSEILKKYEDAFLLIVGINENEMKEVEMAFSKFKIQDSAYKIISHIPQERIPYFIKSSDVLVMNYPNIKHYAKYMSPVKMFEYMASGVPIVASDLPSIREVLNERNSILVEADNYKLLADGIENAFYKSGEKALEDVKQYTWDNRAKNIINFIKND